MIDDRGPVTPAARVSRSVFRLAAVYFSLYVLTTQMLGSLLPLPVGERTELGDAASRSAPSSRGSAAHVFRVHLAARRSPAAAAATRPSTGSTPSACWSSASLITAVWSALDRLRTHDARLDTWFRLFARFALGSTMVSYGMVKAFPMQMPSPGLTRLLEPYGYFSPMGVLWASVGASRCV